MTVEHKPLVSVVMPVYNTELYLAESIESILAQTFTDFEFIIVDDGSSDGSPAIIREYERRDSRIRLLELETNMGSAIAKNLGNEAARGEYIAGMDSDDVSLPRRLEKQVEFLRANPGIGAVGTRRIVTDQNLKPCGVYEAPEKHARIAYNIFMGRHWLGSTMMIRRGVLNAVGGFESSRKRGEDIEFLSRLLCAARVAILPDKLYMYRQHPDQVHSTPETKRDWADLMRRLLSRLWGEAPQTSLDRMVQVRRGEKLNWLERRRARRDISRLINSMVAAKWIEEEDRAGLIALMNRQLERTSPRLWQKFCHWRRHNIGETKSERNLE